MSEMANKLWDYCQYAVTMYGRSGKDWAFGAINFAYMNDLITTDERDKLAGEFCYWKGR